jgi:hypothetical protein
MTVIRTLLTTVLPVWALLAGLGACNFPSGEGQVDANDARKTLEQQRTDVRLVALQLANAAERRLQGTTRNSSSGFRGCESAFNEQFRTFQYRAQARIDTGSGPDSGSANLEKLRPVLEEAGFTVEELREEPNGFATLAADRGDLSASFVHTGGPFVGLDVFGPCIEVPEDQRERWFRTKEPNPEIG